MLSLHQSIRRSLFAFAAVLLFIPLLAAAQPPSVLIRQITVISADAKQVKRFDADVLLNAGVIQAISKPGQSNAAATTVIDGRGKYLIPGLIDSHVHLANIAGMHWGAQRKQKKLVDAYLQQLPKSYLYHGFTTLIDLNNYRPDLLKSIAASSPAPRIVHCGAQLQLLNDFNVVMEDIPADERRQLPYLALSADQDDEKHQHSVSAAVARVKQQQGRCLKIAYEDDTVALPVLWQSPDVTLLTELARQPGLPLVVHAPSEQGHRLALQAKAQVLAHGMWGWPLNSDNFWQPELSTAQQQLLLDIAKSGIGYQPTIRVLAGEQDMLQGSMLRDPLLRHIYPAEYLAFLHTPAAQWAQQMILQRPARWSAPFQQALAKKQLNGAEIFTEIYPLFLQRLTKVMQHLSVNQANLLLGSDTPAMNLYTNPPGYNGFLEMQSWAAAGVPLPQIFRAATYNNATTFGLERLGAIETGYQADLLILAADPLQDVAAYNQIDQVIRQGQVLQRKNLSAESGR